MKRILMHGAEGQTGFPIIDAAIMELTQTGFMHNRMRGCVAIFNQRFIYRLDMGRKIL